MNWKRHKRVVFNLLACIAVIAILVQSPVFADALKHVGIYDLKAMDPNLSGQSVQLGVVSRSMTYIDGEPQNDYRPDIEHNCFNQADIIFHDSNDAGAGISSHSTSICSILFGEDANADNADLAGFRYEGIVPHGQGEVYEFWHFLSNNVFGQQNPQADVITASFGSQFEEWWTRGIDSLVEQYGLIVVAGIGNGTDVHDSILYPGASANVIGVGVVDTITSGDAVADISDFYIARPEHSSTGPTADMRCKPDIVAPGNCFAAGITDTNSYELTGNWSSFSAPIVAGTVSLLLQKARQQRESGYEIFQSGGNCVIKAVLMNSAIKLPYWHKGQFSESDDHYVPLDYTQGAGMLNAVGAYKQLIAGKSEPNDTAQIGWDDNTLNSGQNEQNIYRFAIDDPNDKIISATLIWNRHYKDRYPFEAEVEKDGDLRLELWAVDGNDPNIEYLLDYSDSPVDNVEHIYCYADANYTNYEIIVSYSYNSEPDQNEPAQPYGLAWSANEKPDSKNINWYDLNADDIVNKTDFDAMVNNLLAGIKNDNELAE